MEERIVYKGVHFPVTQLQGMNKTSFIATFKGVITTFDLSEAWLELSKKLPKSKKS
jgi:hypothetical protein